MSTLAAAALEYAGRGWAVFPLFGAAGGRCRCSRPACERPGKHPLVRQGVHEASTDPETLAAWWRRWPWANIGIATGAPSGIIVVDVDRPAGEISLQILEAELGALPLTLPP